MPDQKAILIDSLRKIRFSEQLTDSSLYSGRSAVSIWLDKVTSPEMRFLFFTALMLLIAGAICGYLLLLRAKRAKRNDSLQARSLKMAAFAIFALASNGLFFICATLSLANVITNIQYGQLYWLGWQISLVWFVFFGLMFALGFVRDRKSYDIYFITTITLLAILLSITYNDWSWKQVLSLLNSSIQYSISSEMPFRFGEEHLWLKFSKNTFYAMLIHFGVWIIAFGLGGYLVFRRSKGYQDESARNASYQLSWSLLAISLFGVMNGAMLYVAPRNLFSISPFLTVLALALLFASVRSVYKHGRYRRV